MAYVRSLAVLAPLTAALVAVALLEAGLAWVVGTTDTFQDVLHWCLYLTAVLGVAAGAVGNSSERVPGRLRESQPGEITLSPGASLMISSALVAALGFLVSG